MLTTGCRIEGSTTWTSDSSPGVSSRLTNGTNALWLSEGVVERELGTVGGDVDGDVERPAESEAGLVVTCSWVEDWVGCAMTSEAAVTSCVKFLGPLVVAFHGRSCLVDHWRRCW